MAFNSVKRADDLVLVRNVLISTYDKSGLAAFVQGIVSIADDTSAGSAVGSGIRLYSTGGTYDALKEALAALAGASGPALVKVSDYTGQPEMKGGLVKTLDWKIYLGLLAEKGDAAHEADLARSGAVAFDMVIANLYPFAEAASDEQSAPEDLRQRIDIGGPCMIRAAAKNYLRVASVSSPDQYSAILAELKATGGATSFATRRRLAVEAFSLTSRFDKLVSHKLLELDREELASAYGVERKAGDC
jgi:phosphoribosylaminoimidazolecarboxamide formyltransferase/IMP cyclohydrolase